MLTLALPLGVGEATDNESPREVMSRVRTVFVCRDCGAETPRWEGRCPTCGEWNSLDESTLHSRVPGGTNSARASRVRPLGAAGDPPTGRLATGFGEVDRVLGGGIVPGSVVLLGGAPGIGKSTLLLQIAGHLRERGHGVLYVSGEESAEQVAMRGVRLGTPARRGLPRLERSRGGGGRPPGTAARGDLCGLRSRPSALGT